MDPDDNLLNSSSCIATTISEYNDKFNCSSDAFTILNFNLQSFHSKKPRFNCFLESINEEFDVLVLTETWNCIDNVNFCYLDNYNGIHTYRTSPRPQRGGIGGCVSIFAVSRNYKLTKIDDLSFCNETIESCVAKISIKNSNGADEIVVIGVYRPHTDTIENFVIALQNIVTNNSLSNKKIFIVGDANIDITASDDSLYADYLNMLHSLNFSPVITEPTRYPTGNLSRNRPTTLDHIFINQIVPWKAAIFMDDISDHCGCVMRIENFMTQNNIITKSFSFRPFNNDNLLKLENNFLDNDWSLLLASTDINE